MKGELLYFNYKHSKYELTSIYTRLKPTTVLT